MTEPSSEEPDPATIRRFPQHPAPAPDRHPVRLPSPIEDEMEAER